MAPNIAQSGTAGRDVWYTGTMQGCPSSTGSFSFRVPVTGGCYDVEANHGHDRRAGSLRAAARGAGACGHAGQRNDADGPGDRPELSHHQRRDGPIAPSLRAGVRQGGSGARPPVERRDHQVDRHVARSFTGPRLANPVAVAALGGELLVSERTGEAVVLDTTGRPVREWDGPHLASLYAAYGTEVVAVRSPYYIPQFAAEPDTAPLIRVLDTLGRPAAGLATIHVPPVPYLAQLVNAGAVALAPDGSVYFAPLVRDEIRKYGPGGALRWTAKRGLFRTEPDPEFLPPHGRDIAVRDALVNVALTLGPDGRLYALGSDDSSATRLRIDVLDTAGGAILATRHLGARETAVAVDARGRLATFDADSLLGRSAPPERTTFTPAFALPDVHGDTVLLARFAGKVTLVNFWASWCDPCREEFPHMAQLYRELDRKDFEIVAISDDVDRGKMAAFLREYRPPFPILVGGGRMKQIYHYRGLPYSVLLDRRGRIIERIFGFGGAAEFGNLRDTIAIEVRGP